MFTVTALRQMLKKQLRASKKNKLSSYQITSIKTVINALKAYKDDQLVSVLVGKRDLIVHVHHKRRPK